MGNFRVPLSKEGKPRALELVKNCAASPMKRTNLVLHIRQTGREIDREDNEDNVALGIAEWT